MKKILLSLLLILTLTSCKDDLEFIEQEVIDGKVSQVQKGDYGSDYSGSSMPKIWVQTPTQTTEVEIPFKYDGKWKVGDSCLLIIQKYKVKPKK